MSMPADASSESYGRGDGLEACRLQDYTFASLMAARAAVSLPMPEPAEPKTYQPRPPVTTAFLHEAALTIPALYAEPMVFIESGARRFHKRYEDLAEGLTAEELSAEAPTLSASIKPEDFISIPSYTPPDITRGRADRMEVSITFDGGSDDNDAAVILKALRDRGIKTTIFLTGAFITNYPELVRQMVVDGHEIGNHTLSHPHLTDFERTYRHSTLKGVDRAMLSRELRGAAKLFKDVAGVEMAPLWRAPYGEVNAEIRRWAFEEGYAHVGWTYDSKRRESLDTLDWVDDAGSRLYRTSKEIRDRILNFGNGRVGGGIVLMHLGSGRKTDKASSRLGEMLDALQSRGFKLVKLSTLLDGEATLKYVRVIRKERLMKGLVRLNRE